MLSRPDDICCIAGLSRAIEGSHLPNSGQLNSLEWMAPERLVGEVRDTDMLSLVAGIHVWQMLPT